MSAALSFRVATPRPNEDVAFIATPTLAERPTHYCPGCHHGIGMRLVSELLDEKDLAKSAIGVASVGCSVFSYNYIDTDFVEAAHGRACAVATGVKAARPNAFVFTYQGDGDLAAIGLNETMQAANRGARITVVFVNNTVYGMTGGQMAPTTMIGQKTTTSPRGRDFSHDGAPIRMAEIIGQLGGVAFSARCALDTVKNINAAKRAMRKAFEVQQQDLGFGFIELLSGCPTNLHLDARAANKRITEELIPYFPLGVYKDVTAAKEGA